MGGFFLMAMVMVMVMVSINGSPKRTTHCFKCQRQRPRDYFWGGPDGVMSVVLFSFLE